MPRNAIPIPRHSWYGILRNAIQGADSGNPGMPFLPGMKTFLPGMRKECLGKPTKMAARGGTPPHEMVNNFFQSIEFEILY